LFLSVVVFVNLSLFVLIRNNYRQIYINMQVSKQIAPLLRNAMRTGRVMAVRASSAPAHHHHKSEVEILREHQATLNDLPIPAGSWQEHYDKRNSSWNILLGLAALVFAGSATLYLKETTFLNYRLSDLKKFKIDPSRP
jgi:hypothetical protein